MAPKMAGVLVLLLAGLAVLSCCSAAETKAETKGYDSWYQEKCPPPPKVDEKCPPPPCPPPPKQCPPPPCPPPPSKEYCPPPPSKEYCPPPPKGYCPPPPSPPKYCPPPPPKVDCSKCSCNCEACPICEVCPKCEECPPPTKCDPCPICEKCEKCPPPTKCDPPKCDPCPAPNCDPCPAPKCDPCPAPKCDPCPTSKKCDPCKYGVEGFSDADTEMVNSLLDFEYVLQGFYKNAAAADFKDVTVKKIASDFSGQTSSHISALTELLKAKAGKKQNVNLSKNVFANIMSAATGKKVEHFDAYASGDNVLLGASVTAPMASSMSTAILSKLQGREAQNLVAAVSSQLSAQSAAVNVMLLERSSDAVAKSGLTVAQVSSDVAKLQQKLNALTTSSSSSGSSSNFTTTTTSFEASSLQFSGFSATSPSQVKAMLKELGFFS